MKLKYIRVTFWLLLSALIFIWALSIWHTETLMVKLALALAFGLAGSRLWDSAVHLRLCLKERASYRKLIDRKSFQPTSDSGDDNE